MIRPLVDEEKLQTLEELEFSSMRPEFVEQVMNLRRKVLNQVQTKRINGQTMDGATWVGLVQLYADAFNEGKVPNIESSWNYICKQRAQESLDSAIDIFEQQLTQVNIPCSTHELEIAL